MTRANTDTAEAKGYIDCKYNHGVICGSKDNCPKCGWNPSVASDRKLKRIARDARITKGETLA